MKLLLHACCAPCAIQCVESLRQERIQPALFWYSPNIHPFTEYRAREESLVRYAQEEGLQLAREGGYGLPLFLEKAGGASPARCVACYDLRLERTARYAAQNGYAAFCTTLLISPYQNRELLLETARRWADAYGVQFLDRDFRPLFRLGQRQARARQFYMQKYCGCIFSEMERYVT